jgi:uncharacterized protein (DUF305 family)
MRLALTFISLLLVTPLAAQSPHNHGHSAPKPTAAAAASPSTKAYAAANEKMHRDMNIVFSGDADADFVRGMIPHHQGAVDMARIVLQYGKDPEIRKMAEAIIREQEKEIAQFHDWLKKKQK